MHLLYLLLYLLWLLILNYFLIVWENKLLINLNNKEKDKNKDKKYHIFKIY